MLSELAAIALLVVLLAGAVLVVRIVSQRCAWPPEIPRKVVHIALGLACLSFPWLFHHPRPVWALAAVCSGLLLALRLVPALARGPGRVLHGVARQSLGDLLFPLAVAAVFHLSLTAGEFRLLAYLLPVALLTVADPAGALVGRRPGNHRFHTGSGRKSAEGCAAVFLLALALALALPAALLATSLPWPLAMAAALLLAALTTAAEAACDRGTDNLVIPLGAWFVIDRLLVLPPELLPSRLALLALILLGLFLTRNSTSLDPGALLAAALLAYAIAALGAASLLLPPLALLGWHLVSHRSRNRRGITPPRHRADTVLAHACGLIPLLALPALNLARPADLPWLFALSSADMLTLLRLGTRCWDARPPGLRELILLPLPPLLICLSAAILAAALGSHRPLLPARWPLFVLACPLLILPGSLLLQLRGTAPTPRRDPWLLHGLVSLLALPLWCWLVRVSS